MTTTHPAPARTYDYQCPNCDAFPFASPEDLIGHQHNECGRRVSTRRTVAAFEPAPPARGDGTGTGSAPRPDGATDKQLRFIATLLTERPDFEAPDLTTLSKRSASQLIDRLLATPAHREPAPAAVPSAPTVERTFHAPTPAEHGIDLRSTPPGVYNIDGTVLKIDVPETGKWVGFIFVKRGATLDLRGAIQRPGETLARCDSIVVEALRKLTASPAAALGYAIAYGRETGHCGICGRELRVKLSLKRGIGPVCYAKFGLGRPDDADDEEEG